jgi:hypothetical protein
VNTQSLCGFCDRQKARIIIEYKADGKKIISFDKYESFDVALCDDPEKAIILMNKAHYLNDVKRQYTASARLFYQVECLPGFQWITP